MVTGSCRDMREESLIRMGVVERHGSGIHEISGLISVNICKPKMLAELPCLAIQPSPHLGS